MSRLASGAIESGAALEKLGKLKRADEQMILDEIMASKGEELKGVKESLPIGELIEKLDDLPPVKDFAKALRPTG